MVVLLMAGKIKKEVEFFLWMKIFPCVLLFTSYHILYLTLYLNHNETTNYFASKGRCHYPFNRRWWIGEKYHSQANADPARRWIQRRVSYSIHYCSIAVGTVRTGFFIIELKISVTGNFDWIVFWNRDCQWHLTRDTPRSTCKGLLPGESAFN